MKIHVNTYIVLPIIGLIFIAGALAGNLADSSPKSISLPATVQTEVFTNVVEQTDEYKCPHGRDGEPHWQASGHMMLQPSFCQYRAPTTRWVASNIVKRVTLTVEWNGRQLKDVAETNLFSKTTIWTLNLNPEWKESK
jgi:hypothetical protein